MFFFEENLRLTLSISGSSSEEYSIPYAKKHRIDANHNKILNQANIFFKNRSHSGIKV
jgi:hypothetical protein